MSTPVYGVPSISTSSRGPARENRMPGVLSGLLRRPFPGGWSASVGGPWAGPSGRGRSVWPPAVPARHRDWPSSRPFGSPSARPPSPNGVGRSSLWGNDLELTRAVGEDAPRFLIREGGATGWFCGRRGSQGRPRDPALVVRQATCVESRSISIPLAGRSVPTAIGGGALWKKAASLERCLDCARGDVLEFENFGIAGQIRQRGADAPPVDLHSSPARFRRYRNWVVPDLAGP